MAITRAQQAKQMLQEGGRIGLKGGADASEFGRSGSNVNVSSTGSVSKSKSVSPGAGNSRRGDDGPDDRSSDLQTYNTYQQTGRYNPELEDEFFEDKKTFDPRENIRLNKREKKFKKFLDYRKPVKLFGLSKVFEGPAQAFSNFNASINRPFFEKVLRAGKIPGVNFGSLMNPNFNLEKAYQDYMKARLEGKTDAYGNPKPGFSYDDDGNLIGRFVDDDPEIILPQQPVQDPTTMLPQIDPIFYRLMADGGMTDDAPMIQGGITDLALRDEFFLGGVVKGIKKGLKGVTRAVKKIAKSPIGKAALFAGIAGIPFGGDKFFGSGSLFGKASGLLKSQGVKDFFFKDGVPGFKNLSTAGIVTPLLAAPFIGELLGLNKPKEDEEIYAGPGLDFNAQQFYRLAADGGRIGYAGGTIPSFREYLKKEGLNLDELDANTFSIMQRAYDRDYPDRPNKLAEGGKPEPVAKKTMPLLDMGGKEKDYRETGGFVDMGRMEKADDVPARLSKNEFVFTAEAVRNAGDGDVDKGSEVMYNMMKNLEAGGEVSEESQGLEGAREMFQTSKRLEEVL